MTAGGSDPPPKKGNTQKCFVLHIFSHVLRFEANPPTPSQMELHQQPCSHIIMNNLLHPISKSRAEIPTIFGATPACVS